MSPMSPQNFKSLFVVKNGKDIMNMEPEFISSCMHILSLYISNVT